MRHHLTCIVVGLELCLAWNAVTGAQAAQPKFRADQILVMPTAAASAAALARFHQGQGATVVKTFDGIRGLQLIRIGKGVAVEAAIERYQRSGLVEYAEPDYEVRALNTPNDPRYLDGTQWALHNMGQGGGTVDADIDAPEAWDVRNSASNVVVAVIDTGVRYSHEDLVANMWTNSADGSFGWNALTATNNPSDENGHGTLVAGVLGAVGNNGVGISGVAWRVRIMACRALGSFGIGNVSDIITCLDYARTNGAAIINASWGLNEPSDSLSNAVHSLREAGIILVAACGNSANDIDTIPIYPASYPFDNIVSVAFTTRNDALAAISSFGATRVDLAAPGEQIISTFGATDNFYYSSSGSSLAAPHVSGALALMLARFPGETHQQIIARLLASVDPLPSLAGKCVTGGRLNLRRALSPDIRLTPQPGSPAVVTVAAGPNRQCVTQYSTNLVDWVPFTTNTTTSGGTFQFTNAFVVSPVFFRATAAP